MEKKLKSYITKYSNIDKMTKEELGNFKTIINFLEHERLVHLEVTLAFGVFTIMFFFLYIYTMYLPLIIPFIILVIVLIGYIIHYYYLENTVQKLHDIYESLISK